MSEYTAQVVWTRSEDEPFVDNQYSRGHKWQFDGGASVLASSSPHVVPLPYSVAAHVDPEEAFVASISSCHMLFFLAIAAKKKFVVEQYTDNAFGVMEINSAGNMAMTRVTLRPYVKFTEANQPSIKQLERMHHLSHQQCFIANSVNTEIITQIVLEQE